MKNESVSSSVSLNPRALIGFVPRSIGLLLALFLVFVAFPSSSALAVQCAEVEFSETGEYPGTVYVSASTATSGATIFLKFSYSFPPSAPTHNGSTPTGGTWIWDGAPLAIFHGQTAYFKTLAWKSGVCTDSIVTEYAVYN